MEHLKENPRGIRSTGVGVGVGMGWALRPARALALREGALRTRGECSSRCKGRSLLARFRKSQRLEPVRREGWVREQPLRGLTGHRKDFGHEPDMLHPWKWTCSDLDLKGLLWLLGGEQTAGAAAEAGRPARRPPQGARGERVTRGEKWLGWGHK